VSLETVVETADRADDAECLNDGPHQPPPAVGDPGLFRIISGLSAVTAACQLVKSGSNRTLSAQRPLDRSVFSTACGRLVRTSVADPIAASSRIRTLERGRFLRVRDPKKPK
jgi:hypothetical protein